MITTEDAIRLHAARTRVARLMRDGGWHSADEIRGAGGSEGLRRFRELRQGQRWSKRALGRGLWAYRLMGAE